jgi:hypothetical protein
MYKANDSELTNLRLFSEQSVGRNILVKIRNKWQDDIETGDMLSYRIEKGWLKLWLCEREMEIERLLFVKRKEHKQSCKLYILDQNRTRIIPHFPSHVNNQSMW